MSAPSNQERTLSRMMLMMVAAMLLSIVPCFAQTHGYVQYLNVHTDLGSTPRLATYLTNQVHGRFGMFLWGQSDRNWSQMYVGPTYVPAAWISVAVGAGFESYSKQPRLGSSLWLGHGRYSLLLVDEEGASGRFTRMDASVMVGPATVGYFRDNILGVGPKVSIRVPHTSLTLWATAQRNGQQVVLQYGF